MDTTRYMPFPAGPSGNQISACMVLLVTIPLGVMYPNPCRGMWRDCVRTPEMTLLLQGMLVVLEAAFKAGLNAWFEELPDIALTQQIPKLKNVRFLRLWVPLKDRSDVRNFLLSLAQLLSTDLDAPPPSRKRDKTEMEEEKIMTFKAIASHLAFLRWYSLSRGGAQAASFSTMDFNQPEMGDPDEDADEELDMVDSHPAWHPCNMLNVKEQFGVVMPQDGVHAAQTTLSNYISDDDNKFSFPQLALDNNLVHSLKSITYSSADQLMEFALPPATMLMPERKMIQKIRTLNHSHTHALPETLDSMNWQEVKDVLFNIAGGDAPVDPTIHNPIYVGSVAPAGGSSSFTSESDNFMRKLYPLSMDYQDTFTSDFNLVKEAMQADEIDEEAVRNWLEETEKKIMAIYAGHPKPGMPPALVRTFAKGQDLAVFLPSLVVLSTCKPKHTCKPKPNHSLHFSRLSPLN
jgi:hypothetical protein